MKTIHSSFRSYLGPTFLLAGTAIGSGMISLPIVLAKFGIIHCILAVLGFAMLTYLSALVRSDLNLNTNAAATLTEVGQVFHCAIAGQIGDFLLKMLSLSLLSAYISGGASMLNVLCFPKLSSTFSILLLGILITLVFLFASRAIIKINKTCFIGMFSLLLLIILLLFFHTYIYHIPFKMGHISFFDITTMIPVIFTSFGFQGSIHSMTKLCNNDRKLVHSACFGGSVISAIIYLFWTIGILIIIANTHPTFFQQMLDGAPIEVGTLVQVLSQAASSSYIIIGIQIVSIFAIATSIFGVGLAMLDLFQRELHQSKTKSILFTVWIPTLIAIFIPNAFIKILNVSGIILAIIALIIPTYISWRMQKNHVLKTTPMIHNRFILCSLFICGLAIIVLGVI